mgnify:FL=1
MLVNDHDSLPQKKKSYVIISLINLITMSEVKLYDLYRQVDDSIKQGDYGKVAEICNKSKSYTN